jgi:hypothetical protein
VKLAVAQWVAIVAALGACFAVWNRAEPAQPGDSSRSATAQALRERGWNAWVDIVRDTNPAGRPAFASWQRGDEVFDRARAANATAAAGGLQSAEPEVIIVSLYNERAASHIREQQLNRQDRLAELLAVGERHSQVAGNRTVDPLPQDSIVLLTAWWPIAGEGLTPLPVWDPELNSPRPGGNNYMTWSRVVALDPGSVARRDAKVSIEFAGRRFAAAQRIAASRLYRISVDRTLADRLMGDARTRKAAFLALGRPLRPGDHLGLVALHIAAKQSGGWLWTTLWWHDRASAGPFALSRPALPEPWSEYLMDVASDAGNAGGGLADPCFNPWFEARFPDRGVGGGTRSNCISCHQRASYPPRSFLPITSGTPELFTDPAFAPGQLRTDFLWAIARQNILQ